MVVIAPILTVHNRKQKTLRSLECLFSSVGEFKLKVFITDDGCTDGTSEAIFEKYHSVYLIDGDGNLYWNRGMLRAWKEAAKCQPDYFLWLNDDTLLMNDAISRLINWARKTNNESVIVGSTISNINNGVFTYGGMDDKIKHRLIMPDVTELKPCATFNGNIVLIPIKVFEKIGYNDNFFHHSFGDIEYGLRATKRGLINYIAPGYYGYCQRNNPIPPFRRKSNNIIKRYKLLYSPLGANPFEAFYLNIKYYPWYKCFWLFIKLHLNVLFTVDHKQFEE